MFEKPKEPKFDDKNAVDISDATIDLDGIRIDVPQDENDSHAELGIDVVMQELANAGGIEVSRNDPVANPTHDRPIHEVRDELSTEGIELLDDQGSPTTDF